MSDSLVALALTLHIGGFAMWIGSLVGMATMLAAREAQADDAFKSRLGALARSTGRSADIGAAVAVAGGVWLLSFNPSHYAHQPWLHLKLTLVVGVLGLHGFLRMKAKRASQPGAKVTFPKVVIPVISIVAWAIVAVVVFKPWAR